jgi:hypothetical protein
MMFKKGVYKLPLDEIEKYYKSLSKDVFGQNMAAGITNLISKQSYYDTQHWEKTLRYLFLQLIIKKEE